mgnify:CR=1 FL=1
MAEIKTERLDSYRRLIDISRDLASTLDLDILLFGDRLIDDGNVAGHCFEKQRLVIDGEETPTPGPHEYPDIYRLLVDLIDERRSLVDVAPLRLVIDCYGYFTRPRIAWAGMTQVPPALAQQGGRVNRGGPDADELNGMDGGDTMEGGAGIDTLDYAPSGMGRTAPSSGAMRPSGSARSRTTKRLSRIVATIHGTPAGSLKV